MAAINPSTNSTLMAQRWTAGMEQAVYDNSVFIGTIAEHQRLMNTLNIRKAARFTAQTLAQSALGTTLTYNETQDTTVTITPTGIYVATDWMENFDAQLDFAPLAPFRQNCEDAMSEYTDQIALDYTSALTTNIAGAYGVAISAAAWRDAVRALRVSARSKAEPGKNKIYAVIDPEQWDELAGITEFTHAEIRGTGESALVSGLITKGYGVNVSFSNVVTGDGGGSNNPVYVPSAFGVSWNKKPYVKVQEVELVTRVIVYENLGINIVHDGRATNLRSAA